MSLLLLLWLLAAPAFPEARGVSVAFRDDGPEGIFGVACHRELFGHVEGNAQDALCSGIPDNTVVIYADEIQKYAERDGIPVRDLLLNILRHESAHLELGADADHPDIWDRFRHHEVNEIACSYVWVSYCPAWLAR